MKRIFKFKKDVITDWDEPMLHFLMEYLEEDGRFKEDWKVTINIERLAEKK